MSHESANTAEFITRVISLPDVEVRRDQVTAMLQGWALPWALLDARRGDDPQGEGPTVAPPRVQRDVFGRLLTPGEIGCFRSHVAAWAELANHGTASWMLVLEDDVWFDTDFDVIALLPQLEARGITYLRLFCRWWQPGQRAGWLNERQLMRLNTDPYGAQAYLIHRGAARVLLDRTTQINRPVDDELGRFWEHGLDCYMLFPFPAVERSVPSTLLCDRGATGHTRANRSPARIGHKLRDWVAKRTYLLRRGRRFPNGKPFR